MELKPGIVKLEGRWQVQSARLAEVEDPEKFWDYWARLSVAVAWCTAKNEDHAWVQWGGRMKRGD